MPMRRPISLNASMATNKCGGGNDGDQREFQVSISFDAAAKPDRRASARGVLDGPRSGARPGAQAGTARPCLRQA